MSTPTNWVMGRCRCKECGNKRAEVPNSICKKCWDAFLTRTRQGAGWRTVVGDDDQLGQTNANGARKTNRGRVWTG